MEMMSDLVAQHIDGIVILTHDWKVYVKLSGRKVKVFDETAKLRSWLQHIVDGAPLLKEGATVVQGGACRSR